MQALSFLKRYLPLAGVAFLAGSVALRYLGQEDVAKVVDQVGAGTGAVQASPISAAELSAAVAAAAGVILKVIAEAKRIFAPEPSK